MLIAMLYSVIRKISKFFVSHIEEFMAGHVDVMGLLKVREGNYKMGHGGTRWKLEAERVFFFSRCF
jgi:hypothetical protein